MGDSQNWSSFEEPAAAPKKPKAVAKLPPTPADGSGGVVAAAGSSGAGGLLSAANVRLVQQRLMFGAIVGFCTGATFGSSTWAAGWTRFDLPLGRAAGALGRRSRHTNDVGGDLLSLPSRRGQGVPQAARARGARGAQPVHARGRDLGRLLFRVLCSLLLSLLVTDMPRDADNRACSVAPASSSRTRACGRC